MVVSRIKGKAVSLACYGELAELAECARLLDGWPPTCGPWVRIPYSPLDKVVQSVGSWWTHQKEVHVQNAWLITKRLEVRILLLSFI